MDNVYRNFYRSLYLKTGGFIPSKPLNQCAYPGDFFQIRNGEMIFLGNIFRDSVIDPADVKFENGTKMNAAFWQLSSGVSKPYSGRGIGSGTLDGDFEFTCQVLAFTERGSFFFRGNNPESVRIANWMDFAQQLIIRMTTAFFSFREVYVVTECATTSDWALAVAGSDTAELELAITSENSSVTDFFGDILSRTIQSQGIEYYHREAGRKPNFFKARKLVVQDEVLEGFVTNATQRRFGVNEWVKGFYNYEFDFNETPLLHNMAAQKGSVLDMLPANSLNPNTALRYFRWVDASLDDVEKLFAYEVL